MLAKATPVPPPGALAPKVPRTLLFVALALAASCRHDPTEPGGAANETPPPPDAGALPRAEAGPPGTWGVDAESGGEAPEGGGAVGAEGVPTSLAQGAPSPNAAPLDEREAGAARVYAKTRYVWVRYEPRYDAGWTGFLWLGGSAKLKDRTPARVGGSCTWYAIEPRGYVCVDGKGATLDANDPALVAMRPFAPRLDRAAPYRYGESRGAQRYRTLPTLAEQRQRESDLGSRLLGLAALEGEGVVSAGPFRGIDRRPALAGPPLLPPLPPTLQQSRDELTELSTASWSHEAIEGGRSWLLTGDFSWIPKDRIAPYPLDAFHGVELGEALALPLALFRGKDRPKYRRNEGGGFEPTGESWARLSRVGLTGASERGAQGLFLETQEDGVYVLSSDAVVPAPRALTPWGARVGEPDTTGRAPAGRATWIDTSIEGGWLLAYEGTRPIYATLVSPGRGGKPRGTRPTLETASTPTGRFSINGKFATATMATKREFVHSDVPWSLTFSGPYAVHGAYWHDRWGEKMSAGCVNVSVEDGRWLFHWSEPALPEGWHGVRWEPSEGPTTQLFIRP